MQQQESIAARGGTVFLVEANDCRSCRAEETFVSLDVFRRGVRPVRQQSKVKIAFRAGQIVNLQTLNLFANRLKCR